MTGTEPDWVERYASGLAVLSSGAILALGIYLMATSAAQLEDPTAQVGLIVFGSAVTALGAPAVGIGVRSWLRALYGGELA